ncbi:hypothetical protein ZEAMMB73_Zm00001d011407, partial [Zea mays]
MSAPPPPFSTPPHPCALDPDLAPVLGTSSPARPKSGFPPPPPPLWTPPSPPYPTPTTAPTSCPRSIYPAVKVRRSEFDVEVPVLEVCTGYFVGGDHIFGPDPSSQRRWTMKRWIKEMEEVAATATTSRSIMPSRAIHKGKPLSVSLASRRSPPLSSRTPDIVTLMLQPTISFQILKLAERETKFMGQKNVTLKAICFQQLK